MPLQVESQALISALQSLVLALMMWAGTRGDPGPVRSSMHLRAAALGLEGAAWGALAIQSWLTPVQLQLGGNALNLLAGGMEVIALRMLLGAPLRGQWVLAIGVLGWLGEGWFGIAEPDYRLRVLWGSFAIWAFVGLRVQALLDRGAWRRSRARGVLLAVAAMTAVLLLWRNGQLWLRPTPPASIVQPTAVNYIYVLLSGMQPLFASIGFLLLYSETLQQKLHRLARVDALTGVHNRLSLTETAGRLLAQAARVGRPLGVLMIDADHFKAVNDRFGHAGGDRALLGLVGTIGHVLRGDTVFGRFGGEEFVLLAPDATLEGSLALAERIRATVECTPLMVDGHLLHLTVSIGAALSLPGERDVSALLGRADAALYAAKGAGRNRVDAGPMKAPGRAPLHQA